MKIFLYVRNSPRTHGESKAPICSGLTRVEKLLLIHLSRGEIWRLLHTTFISSKVSQYSNKQRLLNTDIIQGLLNSSIPPEDISIIVFYLTQAHVWKMSLLNLGKRFTVIIYMR